jgi:hypothetical protein
MADSQQTAETRRVVLAIHDASVSRDVEEERLLFSPDLIIEEPPYLPYGGTFHGHAGFLKVAAMAAEYVDFSSLSLESLTVEGALAFVVLKARLWSGPEFIATEEWRVENGLAVYARISWFDASSARDMKKKSQGKNAP